MEETVNRPPVRPFVAALSQMWGSKKLLKLAQAKHRICHTHGNDIKLVCGGAPGFPEMRDSSPTLSTGGSCSGWLPFHQRSLRDQNPLCCARTVTSCFLFPPRTGGNKMDQTVQTGFSLDTRENILTGRTPEQSRRAIGES